MISVYKKIYPKDPILIAAWPGMGRVAVNTAQYLRRHLKPKPFAKMKTGDFFFQKDVVVKNGVVNLPGVSEGKFYYWPNPKRTNDLIIFISQQQPCAEKGPRYAEMLLDFAASLNVKTVFTFAAFLTSMDYVQMPHVRLAATDKEFLRELKSLGTKPLLSSHISGLNGLFLGIAKEKKMKGACLLGEIPFYMSQIENPRASMAILKKLSVLFHIPMDYAELLAADRLIMDEIERLIEYARDGDSDDPHQPISAEDIERIKQNLEALGRIPESAKKQIEDLFTEAKKDISHASRLKNKLDEWHAYKDYEDRFLSLFRKREEDDSEN